MKKTYRMILAAMALCLAMSACSSPQYNEGSNDQYRLGEALLLAIVDHQTDTARRLIKAGAPINYQDRFDKWSPLMYALYYENWDTAKYLITIGANVNLADRDNRTPLMFAAMKDYITVVKMLIDNKADLNARDNGGRSALDYALIYDRDNIAQYLVMCGTIPRTEPLTEKEKKAVVTPPKLPAATVAKP